MTVPHDANLRLLVFALAAMICGCDKGPARRRTGTVEARFTGRHSRLDRAPDPRSVGGVDSNRGIRRDFVWGLSGPRNGVTPDETRAAAWHGGPITMQYQADRPDLGRR